jgi:prophage regulatory protein
MKLLSYDELKPEKGIPYSKKQLGRLEEGGKFPRRVQMGPGRIGWAEHELDAWIADRIAARDAATPEAA